MKTKPKVTREKRRDWWEKDGQGNQLKQFDLVKADLSHIPTKERKYPFKHGETLLYMGEIQRMPGHCIVINKEGLTFWGYHTDNFVILDDDEM